MTDTPITEQPLLDLATLNTLRGQLRENFEPLLRYFFQDTERHIRRMERAVAFSRAVAILPPAHTAKSACRQLGCKRLGEIAAMIEQEARRSLSDPDSTVSFLTQVEFMKTTFSETCRAIEAAI